jgi:hypothetical protein
MAKAIQQCLASHKKNQVVQFFLLRNSMSHISELVTSDFCVLFL